MAGILGRLFGRSFSLSSTEENEEEFTELDSFPFLKNVSHRNSIVREEPISDFHPQSNSQPENLLINNIQNVVVDEEEEEDFDDEEEFIPELDGNSAILNDEDVIQLSKEFFPRLQGCGMKLIFSTESNGFSLNTIYRLMANYRDCATMIIIRDTDGNVFGALLSHEIKISDENFYGTGESFLFRLRPNFKVFRWTGENNFIINGKTDMLNIGSSQGCFGITLDDNLNKGRSQKCLTFDNEPLNPKEDFTIKILEVWIFV